MRESSALAVRGAYPSARLISAAADLTLSCTDATRSMPRRQVGAEIPIAPTTRFLTSRPRLEAELAEVRRRGWSCERREFSEAAACCGAAVLDHSGHPVAAISAAGPVDRMEPAIDRIAPIVASTAEAISRRLGYSSG